MDDVYYPNQLTCADEIKEMYAEINYVMLIAQMQSGKTGAYNAVARHMLECGRVERVYIISGSNDVDLRNQAMRDVLHYNPRMPIEVIFRGRFKRRTGTLNIRNALIIVDESHLDQDKDKMLDQFLKSNGLHLSGSTDKMRADNTYILSVSATPFSEYAGHIHNPCSKEIATLEPGVGYHGVKFFQDRGLVRPTYDLKIEHNMGRFFEAVLSRGARWSLVRAKTVVADAIRRAAAHYGVHVVYYNQKNRGFRLEELEGAPTRPTIVLLDNYLRCGKVVPKKHIGICWEDSKSASTDTVLQSLLGRMCGYDHGDNRPRIYISPRILAKHALRLPGVPGEIEELELNDLDRFLHTNDHILPRRGKNLVSGRRPRPVVRDPAEVDREPVVPLKMSVEQLFNNPFIGGADLDFRGRHYMLDNFADAIPAIDAAIVANETFSSEQKAEMLNALAMRDLRPHFRLAGAGQQMEFRDVIIRSHLTNETPTERFAGNAPVNIMFDQDPDPATYGTIYVVFQLRAKSASRLEERIAKTTGKELFVRVPEPERMTETTPVIISSMRDDYSTDHAYFERCLRTIVARWRDSADIYTAPCITTTSGTRGLKFHKATYRSQMVYNTILHKVERDLGVVFTTTGRTIDPDYFYVASLTWESA